MGSRVTRVTGFLLASFHLPTTFHSQLRLTHGTDRWTDINGQCIMPPPYGVRHKNCLSILNLYVRILCTSLYPAAFIVTAILNKLCAWQHNMPRPAHYGPPPVHSLHALRLRRPVPWIFMIDRQWLALGCGVKTVLVDIHYVVTWTSNQSGLVTLIFDLLILKVVSESSVTWATSVPILAILGLSVFDLGLMYATDRQTSDKSIA